jgi:hypothetical protein
MGVSVVGVRSPRKRALGLWASRLGLGLSVGLGLDFGAAWASPPRRRRPYFGAFKPTDRRVPVSSGGVVPTARLAAAWQRPIFGGTLSDGLGGSRPATYHPWHDWRGEEIFQ